MSSTFELQKSIYTKLKNDTTLSNLIQNIYDYIPDNATFPYLTISDVLLSANNTMGLYGKKYIMNVHIFSQYKGNKQIYSILDQINTLIDFKPITATGWSIPYIKFEDSDMVIDKDYRHLIAKYTLEAFES